VLSCPCVDPPGSAACAAGARIPPPRASGAGRCVQPQPTADDGRSSPDFERRLLDAPGNVLISKAASGLPKDSVANVSQIVTLDRDFLTERAGMVPSRVMAAIDAGLKLVLDLP
jgi:hypothetical protein